MKTGTRAARMASAIREAVASTLLTSTHDPRLARLVITDVRVAPDMRLATVYFHALSGDSDDEAAEMKRALEGVSGRLKRAIQERIKVRFVPELRFHHDDTLDSARRIEEILYSLEESQKAELDADTTAGDGSAS